MWSVALSALFVLETMAAKSTNDWFPMTTRRKRVSRVFPSLQSDRTEHFWGYYGQVARVFIQRHLDACELGDFWCRWHPSYPWGGTQRSQKSVEKVFRQPWPRRTIKNALEFPSSSTADQGYAGIDDGRVVVEVQPEQQTGRGYGHRRSTSKRKAIVYDS